MKIFLMRLEGKRMQFIPHDYKKYNIDYMVSHPITAAILDMGLGKTVCTLTAIDKPWESRMFTLKKKTRL